jgi:LemA protein
MEPQQSTAPQRFVSPFSITGGVIALVVIALIWVATSYNSLVVKNQAVDTQWAQVETQYQRRMDLIPNLVGAVQGAMKQEKEVFGALADARAHYANATSVNDKVTAANQVETSFGRLLAVMENYPQLRSTETVQSLMAENTGTENRVAVERQRYNETVSTYQIAIKSFPGSILASLFGFGPREMFRAAEGAAQAPKVQF